MSGHANNMVHIYHLHTAGNIAVPNLIRKKNFFRRALISLLDESLLILALSFVERSRHCVRHRLHKIFFFFAWHENAVKDKNRLPEDRIFVQNEIV